MNNVKVGIPEFNFVRPGTYTTSASSLSILNLISEPMLRSYNGQFLPAIAQSWQVLDEGRRWIFSLRPNILFHDYSLFTSMDFIDRIGMANQQLDEYEMPNPYPHYLQRVEFRIVDRLTLEAFSEDPNGDIADFLSEILIRKPDKNGIYSIGTGPYRFEDYNPRRLLKLKRIDTSTNKFQQYIYDNIHFKIVEDPHERFEQLKNGDLDFVMNIDPSDESAGDDQIIWHKTVSTTSIIGLLNGTTAPFNDPLARQAINYAVDVEGFIREYLHGNAILAASVVSPWHCGYESSLIPHEYDPDKAKQLFSRVLMPDELSINVPASQPSEGPLIGEFIAEQLRKIGIPAKVTVHSDRKKYAQQVGEKKIGHIAVMDSSPLSTFRVLSDKISSVEKGIWWQGIVDPKADELIHEANIEPDAAIREIRYARVIRYLNQNPHWLYLYHPIIASACRADVHNIEQMHSGLLRFPCVW